MAKKKSGGVWPSWGMGHRDPPKPVPQGSATVPGPSAGVIPDSYIGYHNTEQKRTHKVPHGGRGLNR